MPRKRKNPSYWERPENINLKAEAFNDIIDITIKLGKDAFNVIKEIFNQITIEIDGLFHSERHNAQTSPQPEPEPEPELKPIPTNASTYLSPIIHFSNEDDEEEAREQMDTD